MKYYWPSHFEMSKSELTVTTR